MSLQTFPAIPGLFVAPDLFPDDLCHSLVQASLNLYDRLEAAIDRTGTTAVAQIPQPDYIRSQQHNLPTEEHYTRVALTEANDRTLRCEYFPRYGEDGHALCYFRGNNNLPDYVRDELLPLVREVMTETELVKEDESLTWKLTMNFYKNIDGIVAGFPFHVDIPANGVVTMILNIHREALFQIVKHEEVTDIELPVGSLLVLSGESRYEWKHRVLPMPGNSASHEIERISLVLGFQ